MKHSVLILVVLLISLTVVVSCASNSIDGDVTDNVSGSDSTTTALTGYPKGQVQRMFVFVNGTLYVSADEAPRSELPTGFVEIGKVSVNDVHNIPAEELHAAHIEVGSVVYAADGEDAVYVAEASGKFRKYVICTNGEIWQP